MKGSLENIQGAEASIRRGIERFVPMYSELEEPDNENQAQTKIHLLCQI